MIFYCVYVGKVKINLFWTSHGRQHLLYTSKCCKVLPVELKHYFSLSDVYANVFSCVCVDIVYEHYFLSIDVYFGWLCDLWGVIWANKRIQCHTGIFSADFFSSLNKLNGRNKFKVRKCWFGASVLFLY